MNDDDTINMDRDGGLVYAGRFGDTDLSDDDRDTLRTAFAALVRSGRPLFGPADEAGADALIDPADPGLNTRVAAIVHRDTGPRPLDPGESEDTGCPTGRA